jgi:CheY-like chemotaxis protein
MKKEALSLLVVEDDDIDFLTTVRSLEKQRISNQVVRAKDGIEALAKLKEHSVPYPFIILLDLRMPRMSGIEFLTELRHNPDYQKYRETVVFVLTTSNDETDVLSSYEQMIAGYFLKEHTGVGFLDVIKVIDGYWKIVQLPVKA